MGLGEDVARTKGEIAFLVFKPHLGPVIWDMHVFINQLIECEISFKRNFYTNWNFEFLFCYLAAWHKEEQN